MNAPTTMGLSEPALRALVARAKINPDQICSRDTMRAAEVAPILAAEVLELRATRDAISPAVGCMYNYARAAFDEYEGEIAELKARLVAAEKMATGLQQVIAANSASYFGPDAPKNKRAAIKGAIKRAGKALKAFQATAPEDRA